MAAGFDNVQKYNSIEDFIENLDELNVTFDEIDYKESFVNYKHDLRQLTLSKDGVQMILYLTVDEAVIFPSHLLAYSDFSFDFNRIARYISVNDHKVNHVEKRYEETIGVLEQFIESLDKFFFKIENCEPTTPKFGYNADEKIITIYFGTQCVSIKIPNAYLDKLPIHVFTKPPVKFDFARVYECIRKRAEFIFNH